MTKKSIAIISIFFIFLTFAGRVSAQNNLVLSQVILYDIPASGVQAISVPANKIWKIESVSLGSSGSSAAVLLRNSSTQNVAFFSSPANALSANYPYWLPAGYSGSLLNNNPSYRCTVSITEYSIP